MPLQGGVVRPANHIISGFHRTGFAHHVFATRKVMEVQ